VLLLFPCRLYENRLGDEGAAALAPLLASSRLLEVHARSPPNERHRHLMAFSRLDATALAPHCTFLGVRWNRNKASDLCSDIAKSVWSVCNTLVQITHKP